MKDLKGQTIYLKDWIEYKELMYQISAFEDGDIITSCGKIIKFGASFTLFQRNYEEGDIVRVVEIEEGSGDEEYVRLGEEYPVAKGGHPFVDIKVSKDFDWLINIDQLELVKKCFKVEENTPAYRVTNFFEWDDEEQFYVEIKPKDKIKLQIEEKTVDFKTPDFTIFNKSGLEENIVVEDGQIMYYGDYCLEDCYVGDNCVDSYHNTAKEVVTSFLESVVEVDE